MDIKTGDIVTRLVGGTRPVRIRVTEITLDFIVCGPWKFDIHTLREIDEDIDCQISHLIIEKNGG